MIFPDSDFKEFNPNHDPANGQFTSKTGGFGTHVGISSRRPPDDVKHHRPNAVVAEAMLRVKAQLKKIPGVTRVSVVPALGQWGDGDEFSWAVSYDGNGEARRLMAATGKKWNQDGVLLIKRSKGPSDSMWEMEFTHVPLKVRRALAPALSKHLSGWTWFKREGKTVLRSVSVPAWGGKNNRHQAARVRLENVFRRAGLAVSSKAIPGYRTEVLERSGAHSYDTVLVDTSRFDRR